MKDFFKYTAATVVGIIIFTIVCVALSVMSIVGMVASASATQSVEKNSVLVLKLNGSIDEQGTDNTIEKLTGNYTPSTGLNDILSAIKKAKEEENIKGIYIDAGVLSTDYATLQEIRSALENFRKSGKKIIAYADTYSQGSYYLASVADKIYLNPIGMVDWHGVGAKPVFLKDMLAKFGVKFQVVKVGTFKSATETYTEEHMSDANRLQTKMFLDGTWKQVCNAVSKSRGINIDSLNRYADELLMFQSAESLVKRKVVDGLAYASDMKDIAKAQFGIEKEDDLTRLSISDMANVKEKQTSGEEIAIYYAYGDIVQSEKVSMLGGGSHCIVSSTVCSDLKDLMDDDDVKAVVIRVNSGGGDAFASEQIWHQVMELKKKKPVVVSMGGYAASGAYYMSAPASWIVAQPTTLTGSIGIFAVFPDFSGLVTQKLGVKFDEVKTNRNSTFGNLMARPFNEEETAIMQQYVNRGYQLFRKRVADGRRLPVESVEKIAQGRVWLGADAIGLKLVDQLGGLNDAVAKAAKLAKLSEYYTTDYPAPSSWLDQLLAGASDAGSVDARLRMTLGDLYEPISLMRNLDKHEALQARIPFAINMK